MKGVIILVVLVFISAGSYYLFITENKNQNNIDKPDVNHKPNLVDVDETKYYSAVEGIVIVTGVIPEPRILKTKGD